jgi:antitoxin component of MazEF toxin-antitoxin module
VADGWLAPPSYQQWVSCQSFLLTAVNVLNASLANFPTIRKEQCHAMSLEALLAGITDDNLHDEHDTGVAVGSEVW